MADPQNPPPGPPKGIRALLGAGWLAMAGVIASFANVAVTIVIARLLTSRDYGASAQLIVIFLVLSMPGSAVLVAVVRRVSALDAEGRSDQVDPWAFRLRVWMLAAVVAVTIVSFVASNFLARQLSMTSGGGIAPVFCAGSLFVLVCTERGIVQARRSYDDMAKNLLVEAAIRTALTVALVWGGLGIAGVGIAIAASELGAEADAFVRVRRLSRNNNPTLETAKVDPTGEIIPIVPPEVDPELSMVQGSRHSGVGADLARALTSLALLALLEGLDVIILGRLNPHGSGEYAAISTVAKVLFFAAMVLSAYLLPEATTSWHRGEHAIRQLVVTISILLVPAAIAEVISIAAPTELLRIGFGGLTADAGSMASLVGAMTFLSVSVVLTYYLLGVGQGSVIAFLAVASVALVVSLEIAGGKPGLTAQFDMYIQAALMFGLAAKLYAFVMKPRAIATRPEIANSGKIAGTS